MDLGCKLIVGSGLQEEPPSLPPFFRLGSLYRDFFLHFYFLPQRDGKGRRGGARRGGGMVCVHSVPPLMLSQCFFSLSLELVLRHQPGTLAGRPTPGASGRRQAAPPMPATAGAPARCPLPASPQTLIAQPSGASVFGARGSRRDCVLPSAPTPETPSPHHQHAATSH